MANYKKTVRNPAAEYLYKIQRIVTNTEFKNDELAAMYETMESKIAGSEYVHAVLNDKSFVTLPEREIIIAQYVEQNKYYLNLTGKPFPGNKDVPADIVVSIPDGFYEMFKADGAIYQNEPIHLMPVKYQELFMNSEYYPKILKEFPNVMYLKYIGSNAIPIEVSRPAKDGAIIHINSNKLSTYHKVFGNVTIGPDLVNQFVNTYNQTRDYVYNTLRGDFAPIYANYNSFIRFLTIYMAIGNTLSELMKRSSSMVFMNNTTANNYFVLYGLPSVIMEGPSMISFLKKFRLLLADKGTNIVYRVKDLIGYEYTDIYTLVMVKQQVFENGIPVYEYLDDGSVVPKQRIVFRRFGTTDDNTSYFKFRESTTEYDWQDIASGDPRWWNTPETEQMLTDMNYTLSNSKYIQLSTHVSMTDIYWQCVILLRGLLDNKQETKYTQMTIGFDLDGTTSLSVFDAVLTLVVLMNWHINTVKNQPLSGQLYLPNSGVGQCVDMLFNGLKDDGTPEDLKPGIPYKLSSFNFDIRNTDQIFYASELPSYDYLEPDIFIPMLNVVLDRENNSIGEALMSDVRKIYDYLEAKLLTTRTIQEFRQVTDTFNKLFLVDPYRQWDDTDDRDTSEILMESYDLTQQEYEQFKTMTYQQPDDITVNYNDKTYVVTTDDIMNMDALMIVSEDEYVFRDNGFVNAYIKVMETYHAPHIDASSLSNSVKLQYQNILADKVMLDIGYSVNGATSFDSLLYRSNVSLYRKLISIRNDGDSMLLLMRAIIKSLESYTDAQLTGLEFSALGADDYFKILKEVISYFKSYMVEFTKEEFELIMDGLFDQGGNSNMLRLHDEIHDLTLYKYPIDSLALYDVSNSELNVQFQDDNVGLIHDDMLLRGESTYAHIKTMGYDIWFNDGNQIKKDSPTAIDDDAIVKFSIMTKNNITILIIDLR